MCDSGFGVCRALSAGRHMPTCCILSWRTAAAHSRQRRRLRLQHCRTSSLFRCNMQALCTELPRPASFTHAVQSIYTGTPTPTDQPMRHSQVTLSSLKHFAHGSGGATLWLDPQSEGTSLRASYGSSLYCVPYVHRRRLPAVIRNRCLQAPWHSQLAPEQCVAPAELKRLQAVHTTCCVLPVCTSAAAFAILP